MELREDPAVWVVTVLERSKRQLSAPNRISGGYMFEWGEWKLVEQLVFSQGEIAGLRAQDFEAPNRSVTVKSLPVLTVDEERTAFRLGVFEK
jgi:hypothetical protein